ncbi:hypothetical protein EMIHUDRAFT_361376 [Emiliania huxleyi CCMP1516]|uniref:Uncharacterized protein n=2 Tax=Emiliania huxleyi TaxID=2903 RepID=A0A0D3KTV6_EMIH1|nr:hypothetical protein EMIHUDRAFT_361376 [Emiliania huxleyi CCMP1516]EOD39191.1 hypothetical protein EMIHUDRAFT_361376 [Emiliania huxleyi CCMP1516]|eukprot:XP_005791620.1 hypothetical protein EMIHUDRAFT_361376 [Emiliania huxleyi CCMP1516]
MDAAAPPAPTADAPMHDRPPSDGSPASPAAAARAAADPVPLTLSDTRTTYDNFGRRLWPGEGHDYPPGRRSHQQVTSRHQLLGVYA